MPDPTTSSPPAEPRRVRLGHSPDADDAFMFYGIATGRVADPEFDLVEVVEDIESLNRRALKGELEITAISFHAYSHIADRYLLMGCGASMGKGYGPTVVSHGPIPDRKSVSVRAAVPGELTTAYLLLRLFAPAWETRTVPFDKILDQVETGKVDVGVVIHEGQLYYEKRRLKKVADLGEWWGKETGLPVPLGGNVVRRDIPEPRAQRLQELLRDSIRMAQEHRQEALDFALPFARGLDRDLTSRFIDMYVNDLTLDCGPEGREAIRELLRRGHEAGVIPRLVRPDFLPEPGRR
ncbi:MAG: MqnA/MqnD/SBP family protein [Acidobacteriota bacterium]